MKIKRYEHGWDEWGNPSIVECKDGDLVKFVDITYLIEDHSRVAKRVKELESVMEQFKTVAESARDLLNEINEHDEIAIFWKEGLLKMALEDIGY